LRSQKNVIFGIRNHNLILDSKITSKLTMTEIIINDYFQHLL